MLHEVKRKMEKVTWKNFVMFMGNAHLSLKSSRAYQYLKERLEAVPRVEVLQILRLFKARITGFVTKIVTRRKLKKHYAPALKQLKARKKQGKI